MSYSAARRKESDNGNEDDDDKQNLYSSGNASTTVSVLNLAQPVLLFPSLTMLLLALALCLMGLTL